MVICFIKNFDILQLCFNVDFLQKNSSFPKFFSCPSVNHFCLPFLIIFHSFFLAERHQKKKESNHKEKIGTKNEEPEFKPSKKGARARQRPSDSESFNSSLVTPF